MAWLRQFQPPAQYDPIWLQQFIEAVRTSVNFVDDGNLPTPLPSRTRVKKVTTNTDLGATDAGLVECNSNSPISLTLPNPLENAGLTYYVVNEGTGTVNIQGGGETVARPYVSVLDFPKQVPEVNDTGRCQRAIDSVGKTGVVIFPKRTSTGPDYIISDTLLFYSEAAYIGFNTVISMVGVDKPIMASRNYVSAKNDSPTGRVHIQGLYLKGDVTKPSNHGLLFRDYYSTLIGVTVDGVGGNGIYLTDYDDMNYSVGGSLVENRLINCEVRDAQKYCFYLGRDDNNKLTDGWLLDCIAVSGGNACLGHIYMGSAAGWKIDGIHTYGSIAPATSVYLKNGWHTKIGSIYIETFLNYGLDISAVQVAVTADKISVSCEGAVAGAKAVNTSNGYLISSEISIGSLSVVQWNDVDVYGLHADTGDIVVHVGAFTVGGSYANRITKYSSYPDSTNIKRVSDAVVEGKLRESPYKIALQYDGHALSNCFRKSFTGNTAQTITIPLRVQGYSSVSGILSVTGTQYNTGAVRCNYVGYVYVAAKNNTTDAWAVYGFTPLVAPTGFTVNPTVTVNHALGSEEGTMTLTFTPTDADAYGSIAYMYTPSETQ